MLKNVNSDQVLCLVRCLSVWPVVLIGHVTRLGDYFDDDGDDGDDDDDSDDGDDGDFKS